MLSCSQFLNVGRRRAAASLLSRHLSPSQFAALSQSRFAVLLPSQLRSLSQLAVLSLLPRLFAVQWRSQSKRLLSQSQHLLLNHAAAVLLFQLQLLQKRLPRLLQKLLSMACLNWQREKFCCRFLQSKYLLTTVHRRLPPEKRNSRFQSTLLFR